MPDLPEDFLRLPVAHRGLHDAARGVPENSLAAVRAAVDAGYGIEIDVQPSADGAAMVFHDDTLDRMTAETGNVAAHSATDLEQLALIGGDGTIPRLETVLAAVGGRVPLLVEVKYQRAGVGPLEDAVAAALAGYQGPVAVMSFDPASVARMQDISPNIPRGITSQDFSAVLTLREADRARLTEIADFDRVGASFISHNHLQLDLPAVTKLKARDVPVLCWTIRSPNEEAAARAVADNITFEGYHPVIGG